MKNIRSKIAAIAAVSLFAFAVTSCESVKPDTANSNTVAVTDSSAQDENSAASPDSGSDAAVTEGIGKPPKMDNNASGSTSEGSIKNTTVDYGPTLTIPDIEASAGEEVTFKIGLTNNTGITALIAWLDLNNEYFEFVKGVGGDADDEENEDSYMFNNITFNTYDNAGDSSKKDITTVICFYFDSSLQSLKEDGTYATITLKVKDGTPAGKYDLCFDADGEGNGTAMCNNYDPEVSDGIIIPTPVYKNGTITVK